jgi:hypothetical protein
MVLFAPYIIVIVMVVVIIIIINIIIIIIIIINLSVPDLFSRIITPITQFDFPLFCSGHAVAQLVEALCHKPEGRGFDSR